MAMVAVLEERCMIKQHHTLVEELGTRDGRGPVTGCKGGAHLSAQLNVGIGSGERLWEWANNKVLVHGADVLFFLSLDFPCFDFLIYFPY
jgi:hypothetical protein